MEIIISILLHKSNRRSIRHYIEEFQMAKKAKYYNVYEELQWLKW